MAININLYSDIKPYKWQRDTHKVLDSTANNPLMTYTIKAARQVYGKSTFVKAVLIQYAFKKTCDSIYLTPKLGLARKIYKKLIKSCGKLVKSTNGQDLIITFINDSTIQFFSAEQREALRGPTVTGILIVDEAAYVSDDIYNTVMPWCTVHKAPTILLSTPAYKTGFFYNAYIKGLADSKSHITFDWVKDYDVELTPEILEKRTEMTISKWKSEYLGLFLDMEGDVFGDFSNCISKDVPEFKELYFGLDFGQGIGKDYTVLTAINEKGQHVFTWRSNTLDTIDTCNKIIEIYNKYKQYIKRFYVEKNSMGKNYLDILKRSIKGITEFLTTNESKRTIIERLQIAFQNKAISILNIKDLHNELSSFEKTVKSNNTITYNAATGHHDDMVISLALAYYGYYKAKFTRSKLIIA